MCDILVATKEITSEKINIFAKNSDRDPNESQVIEFILSQKLESKKVKLTYIEFDLGALESIAWREKSFSMIVSRPWWMWGVEMGVNENGVAIGNTAVFTKKVNKKPWILGMDIIRIALMFSETVDDAVKIITEIIQKFGQGGSGSFEHGLYYNNLFVIANSKKTTKIESQNKEYVGVEIKKISSASNILNIEKEWDFCSSDIKSKNFAKQHSDFLFTYFARGRERCDFTTKALNRGVVDLKYIMKVLSSTYSSDGTFKHLPPSRGSMRDVCMHYGGLLRPSQTASSQISELYDELSVHWFTGTSCPCLSIFKPFYLNAFYKPLEEKPTNKFNPKSYWWKVERFHRLFQLNYEKFIDEFSVEKEKIQDEIIIREREIRKKFLDGKVEAESLAGVTKFAYEMEERLISKWEKIVEAEAKVKKFSFYRFIWSGVNKRAGVEI